MIAQSTIILTAVSIYLTGPPRVRRSSRIASDVWMFNDSEQVLRRMKAGGVNALVVLPLYPQFSVSTSGSSLKVLHCLLM
jgi:hypothetical protein